MKKGGKMSTTKDEIKGENDKCRRLSGGVSGCRTPRESQCGQRDVRQRQEVEQYQRPHQGQRQDEQKERANAHAD